MRNSSPFWPKPWRVLVNLTDEIGCKFEPFFLEHFFSSFPYTPPCLGYPPSSECTFFSAAVRESGAGGTELANAVKPQNIMTSQKRVSFSSSLEVNWPQANAGLVLILQLLAFGMSCSLAILAVFQQAVQPSRNTTLVVKTQGQHNLFPRKL